MTNEKHEFLPALEAGGDPLLRSVTPTAPRPYMVKGAKHHPVGPLRTAVPQELRIGGESST